MCSECLRLKGEYELSLKVLSAAARALHAGVNKPVPIEDYHKLFAVAEEARNHSERARLASERHIDGHQSLLWE
jgi:hypothetical protein